MNYLKNFITPLIFSFLFIIISTLVITILNYFNILNYSLSTYSKLIFTILAFFIGGIKIGNRRQNKRWFEGTKFGLIIILFMIIISLILKAFNYKSIVYYIILLFSSIIGSMLAIKKETR